MPSTGRAALLATVLLLTSLNAMVPGLVEAGPPPAPRPLPAEGEASAEARRTGRPVDVDALGTVDTTVVANPDGTFTATVHNQPVRAKTATGWVPIDTTLVARADGTVGPKVSEVPVRFSGGGATVPLARSRGDAGDFGLDWAGRLPKPRLAGSTATYPEILPGVDLRLTATATGFAESLVVRDAAAARNPTLRTLRFGLHTTGPATPRMAKGWKVSGDSLTVQPDAKVAADPDTTYPLTLDGPAWGEKLHWMLLSHDPTTGAKAAYWDSSQYIAKVGRVRGENTRWRSYFEMNTSPIAGKHVLKAQLKIYEWWAESCTPQPVELWHIGAIGPTTTWGDATPFHRKAAEISTARGYDASCEPAMVGFDVTDLMAEAANGQWPTTTVALKAREDNDSYAAKEFLYRTVPELNVGPTVLAITWDNVNTIPNRATDLKVNGLACTDAGIAMADATPRLSAAISDPDPENVRAVFRWWEETGGPPTEVASAVTEFSGPDVAKVDVPDDRPLRNGATYLFGVTVEDERGDASDGRPWCRFTVDTSAPAAAPTVSSAEFPASPATGPPLYTAGRFTFDAGGDPDVVAFKYGIGRAPVADTPIAADAPGGRATVSYTADTASTSFSSSSVVVQAVDRAKNAGPKREYVFKVSPIVTATTVHGYWKADSVSGGRLLDDKAKYPATISGTMTSTRDRVSNATGAVRLDGVASYAATTVPVAPKTAQDTFGSFTVMAWVRLDKAGDHATVLSQDGETDSGFALKYTALPRAWQFSMEGVAHADSVAVPQTGLWTHLAGVYDHQAGKLHIYVNGRLSGEASHTSTWYAAGPTVLGRAKYNGVLDDFWPGDLDELQIYPWAASAFEVRHRMGGAALGPDANWPLDEGTGQTSADLSSNGHTLLLSSGTSWVTPGRTGIGSALRLDGKGGHAYAGGPVAARSAEGTFDSFTVMAWVKLGEMDTWASAVSQDGQRDSGFSLGFSSYPRGWSFGMNPVDADGGGAPGYVVADAVPQVGVWTHLAGVYDHAAGTISLYVNGRLAKSMERRSTWYATGSLQVGRGKNDGWWVDYWPGEVDDVQLLTGVRSAAQITAAAAGPSFAAGARWSLDDSTADATGHGHALALWNGASWTTGRKQGSGLRFDGVEGHAYTAGPVLPLDNSFTMSSWVRLDTLDRHQTVLSQDGTRQRPFRLYYDSVAKAWTFAIAGNTTDGGTVPDGLIRATTPPRIGDWNHVAVVYDHPGKKLRMYVNGRSQATAEYTSVAKGEQVVTIGRTRHEDRWVDFLAGAVDDVTLSPHTTSPEDIVRLAGIDHPIIRQEQPTRIDDLSTVDSPLVVSGLTADMAGTLQVSVKIVHSYRGDLQLRLIAPDNTDYLLEDLTGGGDVDDFEKTYWLNASGRLVNGTWKLRVVDRVLGDTGTIERWSLAAPVSNEPGPAVPWPKVAGSGFTVANNSTTSRSVTVSGIPGNAPSNLQVTIDKSYAYAGDLHVTLIGPNNREYLLHDGALPPSQPPVDACGRPGDPYDLKKSFFVNAGTSPANGVWTLRIKHTSISGAPTVTGWSLSSAINLQASPTAPETKFANATDIAIDEYYTTSAVDACGVPGTGANDLRVAVDIRHPNRGDLRLELLDPAGSTTYLLEEIPDTDTGEDVRKTYTVSGVARLPNGIWYLRVLDARTDWAGVINEWSIQILPSAQATLPSGWKAENTADVPIVDDGWTESPVTVTGLAGMGPKDWRVSVDIKHTHRGDLALYIQAPDGTGYLLEDLTTTEDADDLAKTYTFNASSEIANGVWKLRVLDAVWGDTGTIDAWSLSTPDFPPVSTNVRVPVADLASAESPLTVSGVAGNVPNGLRVQARIAHPKPEQLVVTLVAPDGTAYRLHDRKPALPATFAVDAGGKAVGGTWKLRVEDAVASETGAIESWGLILAPSVAWPEQRGAAFAVQTGGYGTTGTGYAQVSGVSGYAPANLRLTVDTSYYWVSELKISLVAPDGTAYVVHDGASTMSRTFTVDASAEVANGSWKLVVQRNSSSGSVSITAWSLYSPVNHQATPAGPATKFANGTDEAIPDDAWSPATSSAQVSGIVSTVAHDLRVAVDIRHPNRGDLRLTLRTPDGAVLYPLEDIPDSDTGDDIFTTYTVPGVAQRFNGYWDLVVVDTKTGNAGTIDGWSIQLLPSAQAVLPDGWRVENGTDMTIPDYATMESPVTVAGLTGMAPRNWQVSVALRHPHRSDLRLDLVAPDGTVYLLEDLTGTGDVDDLVRTYTFNGSAETANGVWKLRIRDNIWGDVGHLDAWSLAAAPAGAPAPPVAWPRVTRAGFTVDGVTYGVTGESYLDVTGVPGNTPGDLRLTVGTTYTWLRELKISLVAPDGTAYVVHDGASTMAGTFTVDASAEVANGSWKLSVQRNSTSGTVQITSWSLWSPVSQTPPLIGPVNKFANGTDVAIIDDGFSSVDSGVQVSGIAGNAPADMRVAVDLKHTNRGDLILRLLAPDGTAYLLEDFPNSDTGDNVFATYQVNGSAETANGYWRLRVADTVTGNTGSIDGWSLSLGSLQPAVPGTRFENGDDVAIVDGGTVESTVSIAGLSGAAPSGLRVGVTLRHPQRGDLSLHLVAPDGTGYPLEDFTGSGNGDDVVKEYAVNASAELANGVWRLRVVDAAIGDTGLIDGWSLTFPAPTKYHNATDVSIMDGGSAATSGVQVTGRTGNAPANLRVVVDVKHPNRGDLVLHLVAPDGTAYLLEDVPDGDTGDHVRATYWVDASTELASGGWALQVRDTVTGNTGSIDAWSLQFGAE